MLPGLKPICKEPSASARLKPRSPALKRGASTKYSAEQRAWLLTVCFLAACLGTSAPAQEAAIAARNLDLKGYIAELDRISGTVKQVRSADDAKALNASVPAEWSVQQDGVTYKVPTRDITDAIASLNVNPNAEPKKSKETRKFLEERLSALRSSAEEMTNAARMNATGPRAKLEKILSRREFGRVREPSWWDRMKQRIAWWIYNLLNRIFGAARRSPRTGYALMWVVIIAAFALLAVAAWGWLARRSEELKLNLGDAAPPAKRSREWLTDARAAAKRGDYRNAIRCAYWAAIFKLEETGRWKVNLDQTPREYLRKLAPDDHHRPPLDDLTRCFELTWYGYKPATSDEFSFVTLQLERLGCLPRSTAATPGS